MNSGNYGAAQQNGYTSANGMAPAASQQQQNKPKDLQNMAYMYSQWMQQSQKPPLPSGNPPPPPAPPKFPPPPPPSM